MTPQEKAISEANQYVMPSVDDYLGARCLLLNNIFVGLQVAHEAVEKLMKAVLILEDTELPKLHSLEELTELLLKKDSRKYKFLSDHKKFIERLDKHYGWRYYDGDITKRSQIQSPEDLKPFDVLWIAMHEQYTNFLPSAFRFRTYFYVYLFDEGLKERTNWSEILKEDNDAIQGKLYLWERGYKRIFGKNIK